MRPVHFSHVFMESIPERLDANTLYVSIKYATAIHSCACGCGREVVTPLSPTDWTLSFDGRTVSLSPSIGNWSSPCRSHYFFKKDRIRWAPAWSDEEVVAMPKRMRNANFDTTIA